MADYLIALTGIHSRSEETIQATQDWERARISPRELSKRFGDDTRRLVDLQQSLSFDFVSDGLLTMHWQDILRPFTTSVKGVKKGAMVRWFNTNTFYFTPVVAGELLSDGSAVSRTFNPSLVKSEAITKVILPDPLTFVELAENSYYTNRERLIFAYCDNVLRPEVEHLSRMGIGYVQFSAPGVVARFRGKSLPRAELEQAGEGLRTVLKGVKVRSGYHTFFGDAAPYLPALFDLIPTDDIGFDFTETDPASLGSGEGLIAGVADARSSYVESAGELALRMGGLGERFRKITLAPSCDLQYVPRSVADAKLRNLAAARLRLIGK